MDRNINLFPKIIAEIVRIIIVAIVAVAVALAAADRMLELTGASKLTASLSELANKISDVENDLETYINAQPDDTAAVTASSLYQKKIIYDGDSIAESRDNNGGGYAALVAKRTDGTYHNFAKGGARLTSTAQGHSVVDNLPNLPDDGDLYCFEGGINDFWGNVPIGVCDPADYTGELDTGTICGAMETIFRHCMDKFSGKPVCFVIVHKVQKTATGTNANGNTFADYRDAMIQVCQKYSIPFYDAFAESGLNGWNPTQSDLFLTANVNGTGDGTHPNEEGYKHYYVPQLLALFEKIMPVD